MQNNSFAAMLNGQRIAAVWVDSEVTYIMLANGTQISIKGWVFVQPPVARASACEQ